MKRLISMILMLVTLLLFCSCGNTINDSTSNIVFYPNEAEFYVSGSELEGSVFDFSSASNVKIGNSDNYEIFDNKLQKEINVKISNIQIPLKYNKTTSFTNTLENINTYNRAFDWYENDFYRVAYIHGTNILINYTVKSKSSAKLNYTITDESLAKVEEFVSGVMPNDWDLYYKLDVESSGENSKSGFTHIFRRYVYGYEARDRICLSVSNNGEILDFNARFRGYYDKIENKVTKETLDSAKQTLHNMIKSKQLKGLEYDGEPVLDMNADGVLFMYQAIKYQLNNSQRGEIVFIKIG